MGAKRVWHSTLLALLFILSVQLVHGQGGFESEEELKEAAAARFEAQDYAGAKPLYSQLLSLYSKDPTYNYRFGACLLFVDKDRTAPFQYINFAIARPNVPAEAWFYLGKAHHLNYEFFKAEQAYNTFKAKATGKEVEKFDVDQHIRMCNNGKVLLRDITDLLVLNKSKVKREDYFRSYDLSGSAGKLILKPDEFKLAADKRKNYESVLYLNREQDTIYFSSYGEKGKNGLDIYFVTRTPEGDFSPPQPIAGPINTQYDEAYPFLSPEGDKLYFASNGHNSMGGYDVFVTERDPNTGFWTAPKNLDYAINTPDDDFLYVTDGNNAYFASTRENITGEVTVYTVRTERVPLNLAVIKGKVEASNDADKAIKITVKDKETGEIVGVYETDPTTGEYTLSLETGRQYELMIEPEADSVLYNSALRIPPFQGVKRFPQEINFDQTDGSGAPTVKNKFDVELAPEADELLLASDILRKKAELDVNYTEEEAELADAEQEVEPEVDDNVQEGPPNDDNLMPWEREGAENPNDSLPFEVEPELTNADIIQMAREDANNLQEEADDLEEQSLVAYNLASDKNQQAVVEANAANEAMQEARLIQDDKKREEAVSAAVVQQKEARQTANKAIIAYNLAQKVEAAAGRKQQEADKAKQYAEEIEAAINTNNTDQSIAKLEELKQSLEADSEKGSAKDALAQQRQITNAKRRDAEAQAAYAQSLNNQRVSLENQVDALDVAIGEARGKDKSTLELQKEQLQDEITALDEEYRGELEKARDLNRELAAMEQEESLLTSVVESIEHTARTQEVAAISETDKQQLSAELTGKQIDIQEEVDQAVEVAMSSIESKGDKDAVAVADATTTDSNPASATETDGESDSNADATDSETQAVDSESTQSNTDGENSLTDSEPDPDTEPTTNDDLVVPTQPEGDQPVIGIVRNNDSETEVEPYQPPQGVDNITAEKPRSQQIKEQIEARQAEATSLRQEAAEMRKNAEYLNKKKDKEALLSLADKKDAEANAIEAELTDMVDEALALETAEQAVFTRSLDEPLESDRMETEVATYDQEASNLRVEAADLRTQAETAGSKTERDALLEQADQKEELAVKSEERADVARKQAASTRAAEQQALAKAVAMSVESSTPVIDKTIEESEIAAVQQSPEFNSYIDTKTESMEQMSAFQQAAESAQRKRREAKSLDDRFDELMAQASTETDATAKSQLEADAEAVRQQADAARVEAATFDQDAEVKRTAAEKNRDKAVNELLKLQQEDYLNILALESKLVDEGQISYPALAPTQVADVDLADANSGQDGDQAGTSNGQSDAEVDAATADIDLEANPNGASNTDTDSQSTTDETNTAHNSDTDPGSNANSDADSAVAGTNGQPAIDPETGEPIANSDSDQPDVQQNSDTPSVDPETGEPIATSDANASTEGTQETDGTADDATQSTAKADGGEEYSSPEIAAAKQEFEAIISEPGLAETVQADYDEQEETISSMKAEATEWRERAIMAEKKKDKEDYAKRADEIEAEIAAKESELRPLRLEAVTLVEAQSAVTSRPLSDKHESDLLDERAAERRNEAANLREDAAVIREQAAQAKSKKDREELLKKAGYVERDAEQAEQDAAVYDGLAGKTKKAEEAAIKRAIAESMDLEVPLISSEVTPEDEANIAGSQAFATYMANKSDYQDKSEQAKVLRAEAVKYDKTAVDLAKTVENIEFDAGQFPEGPERNQKLAEARYVDTQAKYASSKADSLRNESKKLEEQAIMHRATAMNALLEQPEDDYVKMVAYERNLKEGTLAAKAQDTPNASEGSADNASTDSETANAGQEGGTPASTDQNVGPDAVADAQNGETAGKTDGDTNATTEGDSESDSEQVADNSAQGTGQESPNNSGATDTGNQSSEADSNTDTDENSAADTEPLVSINTTSETDGDAGNMSTDAEQGDQASDNTSHSEADPVSTSAADAASTDAANGSSSNSATDAEANSADPADTEVEDVATSNTADADDADGGQATGTDPTDIADAADNTDNNPSGNEPAINGGQPDRNNGAATTPPARSNSSNAIDDIPSQLNQPIYQPLSASESRYSSNNPIPVDKPLPSGVIYKVQVGAFRNPIDQSLFKGFAPIHGESAGGGLTRYTAGLFNNIDAADVAKDQIRALGYSDAFVVAYRDGKRIPLYEALGAGAPVAGINGPNGANEPIRVNTPTGTGVATTTVPVAAAAQLPQRATDPSQFVVVDVDAVKGLFFTVQCGVYGQPVSPDKLYNITPLNSERTGNGNVRYTSGIYKDVPTATQARDRIREIGIADAFVTAYYNGSRITVAEARNMVRDQGESVLATVGGGGSSPAADLPAPTSATGIVYKVYLGAYPGQVPVAEARVILGLSDKGVKVSKQGGSSVYECGEFSNFAAASELLGQVGGNLSQAKVVAYQNGTPIDVQAAKRLTNE